jgi:hypothetical protein
MQTTKLTAVRIAGKQHLELIKRGYRTHHTAGNIAWLEAPEKEAK